MSQPLTPHATIPRPADVAAALAEIERTEPSTIDPARFACVGGEAVPLPPVGSLCVRMQAASTDFSAALSDVAQKLEQFAEMAGVSLESEDDAE